MVVLMVSYYHNREFDEIKVLLLVYWVSSVNSYSIVIWQLSIDGVYCTLTSEIQPFGWQLYLKKKGCQNLDRINEKIVKIPESENLDGESPEKDRALIDRKSTKGQKSELGP